MLLCQVFSKCLIWTIDPVVDREFAAHQCKLSISVVLL